MNLLELEEGIQQIVSFLPLQSGFKYWINQAVLEIAADFELPKLRLRQPVIYHVNDAQWLYDLPTTAPPAWVTSTVYIATQQVLVGQNTYICTDGHTAGTSTQPGVGADWATVWNLLIEGTALYHKRMFKCRNGSMDLMSLYYDLHQIDSIDYFHTDTDTLVSSIAVEEHQFGIYPMANDSISMWFYRQPVPMVLKSSVPDGIPAEYHRRVIFPKVALLNFEIIQNFAIKPLERNLQYWKDKYEEGLYGVPRGDIGMINFFAKDRFHGRSGGRDPLP